MFRLVLGANTPDVTHLETVHPFDTEAHKRRNLIERMFCRLKDWRRVATRYDKLKENVAATCFMDAIVN